MGTDVSEEHIACIFRVENDTLSTWLVFCFVFGGSRVRISVARPLILTGFAIACVLAGELHSIE
jgi:hypothetical protein